MRKAKFFKSIIENIKKKRREGREKSSHLTCELIGPPA
jgi:hypothetical protein